MKSCITIINVYSSYEQQNIDYNHIIVNSTDL